jgi:integrase
MALTKREIDAARYDPRGPASQYLWDGSLPGFGVRVLPSGRRVYILDYRHDGRKRRLTLGQHGAITPTQARDLALQALADVAGGRDPLGERQAKREATQARARVLTLKAFADIYIARYAKPRKRSWKDDERRLRRIVLPRLGARPLDSITRADVAALHGAYGKRAPGEANQVYRLLSVMRTCAIEWGHLPESTPPWKVRQFPGKKRDRWVRPDELPALLAAIEQEEGAYVRGYLHLALLTGMRRGELTGLKWRHVNLRLREIHLPQTKAGRPHTLPLSPEAAETLEGLWAQRLLGSACVFPSPTVAGQPMTNMDKPWRRVRARTWLAMHPEDAERLRAKAAADVAKRSKHAGAHEGHDPVEDRLLVLAAAEMKTRGDVLRLHDLRRTTGSMLAMLGASLPHVGAVLNHSQPSTTAVYARLTNDAPRAWLEKLGAAVRAAREGA